MLTNPGLVRVTEHQRIGFLGAGESLGKTSRLVVEEVLIDLARRAIHKVYGARPTSKRRSKGSARMKSFAAWLVVGASSRPALA